MANLEDTINDLVVGDNYDIIRTVTNVPSGQYLTNGWLTIRENWWNATYVVQKHITAVLSSGGIISDTGENDTIANVIYSLSSTDTLLLHANYGYTYDLQVKTNENKYFTLETGILTPNESVTWGDVI